MGTLTYCSPEVLDRAHNFKSDIWSCGVISYVLLAGAFPFYDVDEDRLMDKIRKGEFDFSEKIWKSISSEARSFIQSLL